jgi:hypothetical protein
MQLLSRLDTQWLRRGNVDYEVSEGLGLVPALVDGAKEHSGIDGIGGNKSKPRLNVLTDAGYDASQTHCEKN